MILTDDDYWELASQCAVGESGRIDRDGEMFYVSMEVHVDYDVEEDTNARARTPVCASCRVTDFDSDTADFSDVEFDSGRLEEMTYDILMQY